MTTVAVTAVIVLLLGAAAAFLALYLRTDAELAAMRTAKASLRTERDDALAEVAHLEQRVRELEGEGLTFPATWTLTEEQAS